MSVDQLPAQVREFVSCLDGLLGRLDQGSGWCAVFWQRDPDGMRACLDGTELPPWDVMEALLQDLAAAYGTAVAEKEARRVRVLHGAALHAHDSRPGAGDALRDRLDVMLREQRYAVERQAELGRRLAAAATREQADAIRLDLAWAHDDHERATARCVELRGRVAELERRERERDGWGGWDGGGGWGGGVGGSGAAGAGEVGVLGRDVNGRLRGFGGSGGEVGGSAAGAPEGGSAGAGQGEGGAEGGAGRVVPVEAGRHEAGRGEAVARGVVRGDAGGADGGGESPAAVPKQRKRRRGSARFAGVVEEGAAVAVPEEAVTVVPEAGGGRGPRGARFARAGGREAGAEVTAEPVVETPDADARRETAEVVRRLVALRGEGRSGEAHALLVELAYWPAARIPLVAGELQRAGLGADWTTLLWEAASLPAERLVEAADALAGAGRGADGEQILRQGVARPAEEIGQAVLALAADGRRREVDALLDAYVRVRAPEEAARSVAPDPKTLVPLLVRAARGVSDERHWDVVHALRVAGFTA
ncbi:hypothetical protein IAG44_07645 [Streptomyces roseirectus]|uniref:UL36 very large tegument protein n=1 Tax=Streptomyces roseirectus TaxID=2768066 RepID=A0A7H0I957_9ACTN|nr:hypothetical protein [Streptomyces roseirectus]QNP69323.1 hypothetical protein IAG44_07645 [Streptomyces roseirectus]